MSTRLVEMEDGTPARPGDYLVVRTLIRVYEQPASPVDAPIPPVDVVVVKPAIKQAQMQVHVEGTLDAEKVAETVKKEARRGNKA